MSKPAITDTFIKRPVVAVVLNLLIAILGVQAVMSLSIRQYPAIESSTITITTLYVGADADVIRGFITAPIERSISAAGGIDYIESQSAQGVSTIQVRLALGYPSSSALADITARVNQVRAELPADALPPAVRVDRSDAQIAAMYLSFTADSMDGSQLTDYLERVVRPRLGALDGVQRTELIGAKTFALRVWLDPDRMASLSIRPSQVVAALRQNHSLAAVGQTRATDLQVTLTTTADLQTLEEFRDLVVAQPEGRPVRLRDIAEVNLGAESYDSAAVQSGKDAVFSGVWVKPDSNALEVSQRVQAALTSLQQSAPGWSRNDRRLRRDDLHRPCHWRSSRDLG